MQQNSQYKIREMLIEDLAEIASFMQLQNWHIKDIEASIVNKFNLSWVAIDADKKILGYILCSYLPCDNNSHNLLDLLAIEVKANSQNKSVGTNLMLKLIDFAKTNNIHQFFLEVQCDNIAAIKLYEKLNFTKNRIRKNYYRTNNGFVDAIEYLLTPEKSSS